MTRHIIPLILATLLAACGGGGDASDPTQHKASGPRTNLLVLGNSITRHGPLASIGWSGDWGMAASDQAHDYAHLVGATLDLPVEARNVSTLEVHPDAPMPDVTVAPDTVVIVELGDNGLPAHYADLLALVKGGAALVCTSTYWPKPDFDAVTRPACEAAGGTYVTIGDIFTGPQGTWENPAVAGHPGDKEMAEIARRILKVL